MTKLGSTFVSDDPDIRGGTGPAGPTGATGAQGIQGDQGIQGIPGTGIVNSVVGGTFITVDATDPANPIINAADQVTIIDIATFIQDAPTDAEKLMTFVATTAFNLPASLTDTKMFAEVTATAAATIDIKKNGSSVGTINFAIGANTPTFTFASLVAFAVGDRLQLVAQATADVTLADIAISLRGTL